MTVGSLFQLPLEVAVDVQSACSISDILNFAVATFAPRRKTSHEWVGSFDGAAA